jgi:hypothetical protein
VLVLKIIPEAIAKRLFHVHRIHARTEVLVLTQLIILRILVHARLRILEQIAKLKFLAKFPEILVSTVVVVLTMLISPITLAVVFQDTLEPTVRCKSHVLSLLARTVLLVQILETCPDSFVLVLMITLTLSVIKLKPAQCSHV